MNGLAPTVYFAILLLVAAGIWWWVKKLRQALGSSAPSTATPAEESAEIARLTARIAQLEERLSAMDARLATLPAPAPAMRPAPPLPLIPAAPSDVRAQVYRLHEEGVSHAEIAHHLGMARGEVSLLLQLRQARPPRAIEPGIDKMSSPLPDSVATALQEATQ